MAKGRDEMSIREEPFLVVWPEISERELKCEPVFFLMQTFDKCEKRTKF